MDKKPSKNEKEKKFDELARPARQTHQEPDELADPRDRPGVPPIPNIGRADLDPFARGIGGGMIFDPTDPNHFIRPNRPHDPSNFIPSPDGMIPRPPPGARFDPFGPGGHPGRGFRGPRPGPRPGPGQGSPDPDHMRPYGYDDSFM